MMGTASKKMRSIERIASCIVVLVCLAGCTTEVQHIRGSCGTVERDDAVTLVLENEYSGDRSPEEVAALEASISECLQRALKEGGQAVTLILPDDFRRVVFPDLDSTSAPASAKTLASVLEVPHVREKIDGLQLRYLIAIRAGTTSKVHGGAAPYTVGAVHWKLTYLTAFIIDVKNASETGEVRVTVESVGFYTFPIIWPAVTESPACKRFGREIVKFISAEPENKAAGDTP
jgi:hypothetical protein